MQSILVLVHASTSTIRLHTGFNMKRQTSRTASWQSWGTLQFIDAHYIHSLSKLRVITLSAHRWETDIGFSSNLNRWCLFECPSRIERCKKCIKINWWYYVPDGFVKKIWWVRNKTDFWIKGSRFQSNKMCQEQRHTDHQVGLAISAMTNNMSTFTHSDDGYDSTDTCWQTSVDDIYHQNLDKIVGTTRLELRRV